uniref:Uncharacterized protein n=1 Tax=Euplotes harpa TaxID=151035 RepID=A0A7S3JLQ2_9SPIT|mmetsp:Transcript_8242/g.9339  ORF Transcript_8242/g.9339 Transcript_8242/m.9339 type:complete len:216 (+) Transcript_8242:83-730(+)
MVEIEYCSDFELYLHMYVQNDVSLLKELPHSVLPPLMTLALIDVYRGDEEIVGSFMTSVSPMKVHTLRLESNGGFTDAAKYIDGIVNLLKSVTDSVTFTYFKFDSATLSTFFKNASHIPEVHLKWCEIDTEEPMNFTTDGLYKIEVLGFEGCGKYSKWNLKRHNFERIIDAIGSSSFKHSLTLLSAIDCGLSKTMIQSLLIDKKIDCNVIIEGMY